MSYGPVHELCDFVNDRPGNEPPLDWWIRLYSLMEKAEAEAERLRGLACDLCSKGWPVFKGDHVPPEGVTPEGDWDLGCRALPEVAS